jgi:hypothetical protein
MPNRKRNQQFAVRISEDELRLFERKRSTSGLSKTDFFIKLLESSVIKVYNFNALAADIYLELRKIGTNLNQIAYHANAGKLPLAESQIRDIHSHYSEVMVRLKDFLERPLINARIFENSGEI